ncbi:MAG: ester cyclase [Solirubrobacteraceae bacterium]|jgi:glyoxylase-like metal-dependent hydrolase (beta-lactamase superfamily II)/predicted ester cyclase
MSTTDVARRYFQALAAHDLDRVVSCWAPGAVDRFVGQREMVAPDGIRRYFWELFQAFPDFRFEVIDLTSYRGRSAVRWRARATFAGPGRFQGFAPNGARITIEGCDVLTVADERIQHGDAYLDRGDIARQLGFLPPAGSPTEARLAKLANVRTRLQSWVRGAAPERIADGVWLLRGGFPLKAMNVYLLEHDGGVTVFDSGIAQMTTAVAAAGARLGGVKRIVLGNADADHRGAAPGLDVPVLCHPAERDAAESQSPFRKYWDFSKLDAHGRWLLSKLVPIWDGGAVQVAGTIQEGDRVADFRVVELPGHAPGLIGLFREADRLALVSDCIHTLDPQTGIKGAPRIPHPAFDLDEEQARSSVRKLAELEPSAAWLGHAEPVTGDVRAQLEQAASARS